MKLARSVFYQSCSVRSWPLKPSRLVLAITHNSERQRKESYPMWLHWEDEQKVISGPRFIFQVLGMRFRFA